MWVVASQSFGAYFGPMSVVILKLFTLLALALMPFGMNAAMAAPLDHASTALAQHCGEHGSQPVEKPANRSADCAITCSMLIDAETRVAEPLPAVRLSVARPLAEFGTGLHPDTATPPPKLS